MNNTVVIVEGTAYRLSDSGLLETLKLGQTPVLGEFHVTSPETRNMTPDQDHNIKEALKVLYYLFPDNRRTAVQQKAMKGKTGPAEKKVPRQFGVGAKSIYTCNVCTKHIITVDRETGNVWPKIPCNQTHQCRGSMLPFSYSGSEEPAYEWRKPTDQEFNAAEKGGYEQDYYNRDGLIMVPFSGAKVAERDRGTHQVEAPEKPVKVMRSRRAKLGLEA